MPFSRPTLNEIITRTRADAQSRLSAEQMRRSDSEVYARLIAAASHELHGHLAFIASQVLYDTAEAEFLDRWASIWLTTPRKQAVVAIGDIVFTGVDGTVIPADTPVIRADGVEFTTINEVTITSGAATATIEASAAGQNGNTVAGTILSMSSPISGIDSNAVVSVGAITQGADVEDDTSLRERLVARIQQPPQGGAAHDYVTWALEVPGVTRAWVYPKELGDGTVTVRFVRDDDASLIPDAAEVLAVQEYIDALRPVTADLAVVAPVPVPLDFTLAVTPNTLSVKAAVEAELKDLLTREASPSATILLSHIREAISIAAGESNYTMMVPSADITHSTGQIAVMGVITWL
ncbi:baseplate J protein [Methylotenera oryzisoli]|uniref:Baseplate J protein n=1 Tax=Methylotenera oryzisoli TaxID=2080758 RepID=A0A4Y9VRM4_9PROT|nr:baseplate J/gp47 family protein [Methylotenera oryzisoli]TFW71408.1 baseplate J protein [Methylotenera oryzisoli]